MSEGKDRGGGGDNLANQLEHLFTLGLTKESTEILDKRGASREGEKVKNIATLFVGKREDPTAR
jgi:hypothetical protein